MEKIVKKIFLPWQEEKEQAFLEDMARKGYLLTRVQFCNYIFKQIEPRDVVFQSDFVDINVDKAEYLQIFEDAGWHLAFNYGSWYYFYHEKTADKSTLNIFSNNNSKRQKYKRVLMFLLLTGAPIYYHSYFILTGSKAISFKPFSIYTVSQILLLVLTGLHLSMTISFYRLYQKYTNKIKQ